MRSRGSDGDKTTPAYAAALALALAAALLPSCGAEGPYSAFVALDNDFDNVALAAQPPWTICEASFLGVDFGRIGRGETSTEREVVPGLDYVLMVAAWNDPSCSKAHSLPLVSKREEEVVDGQRRTIAINLANHQGPCPPEGIAPLAEAQYERVLERWPAFEFKPYAQRAQNSQCLP
ncbi:MAG: hypothetical protein IPL40_02535 [Proteobacteria bacterium]|nr:hypothetical protein [Pseudomonadota bacterium]